MNTKKALYEGCDFGTLIEKHNPFGVKSTDGNIKLFGDYAEAYIYVLTILYCHFKRGYVDMVVLISMLTGVNANACFEVVNSMKSLWGDREDRLCSFPWASLSDNSVDIKEWGDAILIMRCLHLLTETQFDMAQFDRALHDFKNSMMHGGVYSLLTF